VDGPSPFRSAFSGLGLRLERVGHSQTNPPEAQDVPADARGVRVKADFLSNLIDRAFERIPVLERRRSSRYEPFPRADPTPWIPEAMTTEEPPRPDVGRIAAKPGPTPIEMVRSPEHEPPGSERIETITRIQEMVSVRDRGLREERNPLRVTPRFEQPAPESTPHTVEENAGRRAKIPFDDKSVEPPHRETEAAKAEWPPPQFGANREIKSPPVQNERKETGRANVPKEEVIRPDRVDAPARRQNVPFLQPRAEKPAAPKDRREQIERPGIAQPMPVASLSAAPAIQVTIGRVEIRATHPPSPPKPLPASPRKPKLSLDEYLRQRAGDSK
jgi:hypothetical protein